MKRRLLLLSVLAVLPAAARTQGIVYVGVGGELSSLVGMPFDVPIYADFTTRSDKLGSLAFTLRWNPAVLHFENIMPGAFGTLQVNPDSAAQGVLKVAAANPAGMGGMISLGAVRFTPTNSAMTGLTLDVQDIFSAAPDFADISSQTMWVPGLFCPARGYWGDPDLDRIIGSRDALIALSEAVGLDVSTFFQHLLSDVDADGSVRARDALIILSQAVGLDVSAFRIGRIAIGSCGTEQTTTYSVTPSGDTVVAGHDQVLHFELRATAAGAARMIPDVFWSSSDPNVLAILPDGRGVPVGPGTAVVAGKSGGKDSASAVVTVVARRSRHVVDAIALTAPNQLGTASHPYATLVQASAVASEGDTVIVRPGRYGDAATFGVGVVILGQSGGQNGVVLAGSDNFYGAALAFAGGGRAEVHNVSAERVGVGIAGIGVDTLVIDSLRYLEGAGFCGDYAIATTEIWRLEVRRSDLRGGGANSGCAGGVGVNGAIRMLLLDNVKASDFAGGVVNAQLVDSAVVRNSQFTDNSGYAVDVSASRFGGSVEVPAPTSTAFVLENSHILGHAVGGGVHAADLRDGHVTGSLIDVVENDALRLSGTTDSTDRFDVIADTIRGIENFWLSSSSIDTIRVDASVISQTHDGYIAGYRSARVTNTQITNVLSSEALYFDGDYVRPAIVDNVTITGDPGCTRCSDGLVFYAAPAQVNRLTASNLYNAVQLNYVGGSVTHSHISNVNTGVYVYDNLFIGNRVVVRGDTMTNVQSGVQNYYSGLTVDSLDLTGAAVAVYTQGSLYAPSGADSVRNSTLRNVDGGIELNDSTMVAVGNTVLNATSYPVYFNGNSTGADSGIVLNNSLSCIPGSGGTGVYAFGASYRANGNAVSGCDAGFYLSSTTSGTAEVRGNTVLMPPNSSSPAITVPAPIRSEIVGNDIRGGGYGGAIFVYGYSYFPVSYARVDSNTVHGIKQRAIWFEYTDSAFARANLIDTVGTTTAYSSGAIGIGVFGGNNGAARLVANRVRHVAGHGIFVDYIGSTVVAIDSNAVSTADTSAVRVATGTVSLTANNIRNNPVYGLWVLTFGGTHEVHGNAFQGNGVYAAINQDSGTVVNADGNWWGVDGAAPGTAGADAVLGLTDTAPLPAEPGVPSLSAPIPLRSVALAPRESAPTTPSAVAKPAPSRTMAAPAAPQRRTARTPHAGLMRAVRRPALPAALAGLRRTP